MSVNQPFFVGPPSTETEAAHVLWYDSPAERWTEALPLGNGLQGLMVFGRADHERILLNDSSAWSGSVFSEARPPTVVHDDAIAAIRDARAALEDGAATPASEALRRLQHRHTQAFMPLAELGIRVAGDPNVTGYERRLDLRDATCDTRSAHSDGDRHTRVWSSHPDRVVVIELAFSRDVGHDVELTLTTQLRALASTRRRSIDRSSADMRIQLPSDVYPPHDAAREPVEYDSTPGNAMRAAVVVSWTHDGIEAPPRGEHGVLAASGVRRATVVLSTATTFDGIGKTFVGDDETAAAAARACVDAVFAGGLAAARRRHLADHSGLYDRTAVVTGAFSTESVDRRVGPEYGETRLRADPGLAGLLFNFGRFLLIASSRAGRPPATLQGIWNEDLRPPWSSNYTTNINLPMNYWQTEIARLPELAEPLFDLIAALAARGEKTARTLYGAHGWVAHHNTDAWAYTAPVGHGQHDPSWAFWPFAGPWLVQHLGARLEFLHPHDPARVRFARDRAFPLVRGAAQFVMDWMVEDPDGWLGTSPSTSPENRYLDAAGVPASVGRSSTLDLTLARETLLLLIQTADIIGVRGDEVVDAARAAVLRVPTPRVGRGGRIREWADDPMDEDPQHRHQSHLYFVYPGSRPVDDELAAAAATSLDDRGPESTGWALAWRLALRARLGQPKEVGVLLRNLFRDMSVDRGPLVGGIYPNLFTAHPPFQIDANLGFVAGLAESLVQSHSGAIDLLPALPVDLPAGSAIGLGARGGLIVDVFWNDGALARAFLRSATTHPALARVRYRDVETLVEVTEAPIQLDGRLDRVVESHGQVSLK